MHAHAHVHIDQTHSYPSEQYESHWYVRFTRFCACQVGDESAL